jgi:thiamine biosynthesis lipoprotein
MTGTEVHLTFPCFGGRVNVLVDGEGALDAAIDVRRRLEGWHACLTRFDPSSELSRLNADPAERVHVGPGLLRFVTAALLAAQRTDGLVDPTLGEEIEAAGYLGDLRRPVPLNLLLAIAPRRAPARPRVEGGWRDVTIDPARRTVSRPPGVRLDSGGIAKGMVADLLAARLGGRPAFAIDCLGDVRVGGAARRTRPVLVDDPFGRGVLHTFDVADGGAATSGIGRRSWLAGDGRVAHHLLDPSTGRPAFTGVVQATALAPTALEAEVLAKAAVLSGPRDGARWLPHGGVLVLDDGSHTVFEPSAVAALAA